MDVYLMHTNMMIKMSGYSIIFFFNLENDQIIKIHEEFYKLL